MVISWVDGAVGVIVLLYLWQGWNRSVVSIWSELIAWVLAYFLTLWGKQSLVWWLVIKAGVERHWAEYAAFLLLFIFAQQIFYWSGNAISEKWRRHYQPWYAQIIFSVLPTFFSGIIVAAMLLTAFISFPMNYPLKNELIGSIFGKLIIMFLGI